VIALDTNVVSELARKTPEPAVIEWLDSLPAEQFAITAVTAAELLYGVSLLPAGHRKTELATVIGQILDEDFGNRTEPFDRQAAGHYAEIVTVRQREGRPIGMADAQIAAICRSRDMTLATRNTPDFVGTGIRLIDPWIADR
jgi:predicted nucleic acid-binding protein